MNFDELTRNELLIARIECDKSLLFFTRFWFKVLRGSKFIINKHHEDIEENLKLIEQYKLLLLNINIPPRFSKTELAAVNTIARGIGMNPCSNWLYITASDELRAQTSVSIRDIVQHPYFKIMYGVELKKDQNGKNLWRTNKGGGLKTATIFGQITGFGAGQMIEHNNDLHDFIRSFEGCIVLDDINKIDDSDQENAINDKVSRVLLNTVLSRVNSKDTPIINIQQRAGSKDATAIFQDYFGLENEKVKFLVMPVIDSEGNLLWEWKCGLEEIKRLKDKSEYIYNTQYLQNPEPKEGYLLPLNSIKFSDLSNIPEQNIVFKFSVGDPADTGGDKFSMPFIHVAVDGDSIVCYVKDVVHSTYGIEANTERIVDKAKQYELEQLFYESNGVGLAAVLLIKNRLNAHQKLNAFNSSINKQTRILSHYEFVQKYFVFDKNYENNAEYKSFINDLTSYKKEGDNKNKKDAIDVMCSAASIIKIKYKNILYK